MVKCEHKWVDMEDGTNDKFCVKCRKFAMQGQMAMSKSPKSYDLKADISISFEQPDISEIAKQIDREMKRSMRFNG